MAEARKDDQPQQQPHHQHQQQPQHHHQQQQQQQQQRQDHQSQDQFSSATRSGKDDDFDFEEQVPVNDRDGGGAVSPAGVRNLFVTIIENSHRRKRKDILPVTQADLMKFPLGAFQAYMERVQAEVTSCMWCFILLCAFGDGEGRVEFSVRQGCACMCFCLPCLCVNILYVYNFSYHVLCGCQ